MYVVMDNFHSILKITVEKTENIRMKIINEYLTLRNWRCSIISWFLNGNNVSINSVKMSGMERSGGVWYFV
jgi:hypothetical protein